MEEACIKNQREDLLHQCKSNVSDILFSNSLIIHKLKTKELITLKEVWESDLN